MKLLADESAASLNVRSAYLEVLSDAISSIGVILGGVTIWLTGWFLIDPLLSAGIGVFIVWRTWSLLTQAVHVLMEGVPTHLNPQEVGQAMVGVAGVQEIHDLHIWTITSGLDALSAHVVVSIGEDRDVVLDRLQSLLRDRWKLAHTTLQIVEERSDRVQVEKADN
jgi:cobalt-zinc-cadmium efflux system protein